MESYPVGARTVGRSYGIDGDKFGKAYKNHLSGFKEWDQKDHAHQWMLLPQNFGKRMSLDETMLHEDLTTVLSNKDGHGQKGTVAATVAGTEASSIIEVLMQVPEEQRNAVEEVTLDFSESMRKIALAAFPSATLVVDCFHVMKRLGEAVEEIRLKEKRAAVAEAKRLEREHKERIKRNAYQRRWYRKHHPRKAGEKRGRRAARANQRFSAPTLENGETRVELLTRSKLLLSKTPDKWTAKQKQRAQILFSEYPKIKEAFSMTHKLRVIFKNKKHTVETAKAELKDWYAEVRKCSLREIKSARDTIKSREEDILNYFINRSTNASAESLNSKLKGFRSQLRGISDQQFYMYRVSVLFG